MGEVLFKSLESGVPRFAGIDATTVARTLVLFISGKMGPQVFVDKAAPWTSFEALTVAPPPMFAASPPSVLWGISLEELRTLNDQDEARLQQCYGLCQSLSSIAPPPPA